MITDGMMQNALRDYEMNKKEKQEKRNKLIELMNMCMDLPSTLLAGSPKLVSS